MTLCKTLRVARSLLIAHCLFGCGSESVDSSGSAGSSGAAGSAGSAGASALGCPDGAAAATLAIRDGGRAKLELGPEVEHFELTLPEGFSRDGDTLRAPYGKLGEHSASLTLTCAGQAETRSLTLRVEALSWSPLATWQPGSSGPLGREYFALWIDSGDPNRLLLFGGFHYQPKQFTPASDLWSFDLTTETWSELPNTGAPLAPGGRVAPIPGARALLYHGGLQGNATPPLLHRFEYAPDAMTWTALDSTGDPGGYTGAFVHDQARDRYLSICGASSLVGYHCGVRAWSSTSGWTEIATAGEAPIGRAGFFFALDPETDRFVMYGGDSGQGGWSDGILSDTWALELGEDPPRWVPLLPAEATTRRRNGAYLLDPWGHRLLVWGGTADGATSVPGLWALSLDRGTEAWHEVATEGAPPDRTSGMGVLDESRRRMLAGFGNDDKVYADLWALAL